MAVERTLREELDCQASALIDERKPYEQDWDEIGRLCLPYRVNIQGKNGNNKRRANVVSHDTAGRKAGRTLTNGMFTGLSSSSKPWFKLRTRDPDLNDYHTVKLWLEEVENTIRTYFTMTNYYDTTKVQYGDVGHFGIGVSLSLEHPDYLGVYHPLEPGTYAIGVDYGLRASCLVQDLLPTVKQLVDETRDNSKLSKTVVDAYDKGKYGIRVPCRRVIERNVDFKGQPLSPNIRKPWRSIKWEIGQNDRRILLAEKGFDSQPFTAPRWETQGTEAYSASSPAFDALPDLRELQLTARRGARALDNLVRPPMRAPASLSQRGLSFDPGTVNYLEAMAASEQVGPLFPVQFQSVTLSEQRGDRLTRRVEELFYADLFMAISEMEGVQPRNEQELMFRNEEKLTQLGPVVDRVNIEKLDIDIDRAFTICRNLGMIGPPPDELKSMPLTVDFISILAQAQKAAENTAIERAARFVGFVGGMFPDATLKFDAEQAVDEFARNSGTSPRIIRSDEMVAQLKADQARQQQAAQMAQMAPAAKDGAQAAQLLSQTRIDDQGTTALQQMLGR